MGYLIVTENINDPAANKTKRSLGALWLRQFFDQHLENMVKVVTRIDRQRNAAENPNVFRYYIAKVDYFNIRLYGMFFNLQQHFHYIFENDIKRKNVFNIN